MQSSVVGPSRTRSEKDQVRELSGVVEEHGVEQQGTDKQGIESMVEKR